MTIATRLAAIRSKIDAACVRSHRQADAVTLVAVSKKQPVAAIQTAVNAGQISFGENYAQELRDKRAALSPTIHWHFVGRLQSNKLKYLVGGVKLIHSVESMDIAQELDRLSERRKTVTPLLVQIELADQTTKAGLVPEAAMKLMAYCQESPHLDLQGLMTFPPPVSDPEQIRPLFRRLTEWRDEWRRSGRYGLLPHLSMGMSHDFEVAIEEGATLIRVGTAIFGERVT